MNEIKLPVKPRRLGNSDLWTLDQSNGVPFAFQGPEWLAKEISLSVNCHDALVEAMNMLVTDHDNGCSFGRTWKNARAALAKVEKEKANHLLADAQRYAKEL